MPFVLRVLVMLAAVTPVFAGTAFQPSWWQILLAAAVGSALGQLAVRFTRDRQIAEWAVAAAAALVATGAGVWSFTHKPREPSPMPYVLTVKATTGEHSSLTWDDLRAIQTQVASVHFAAPYLHKSVQLMSETENWNVGLVGTTADYFQIWSTHPALGKLFDDSAATSTDKIVVLGDTVVTQLFGANHNPVGEQVRINSRPFTVIGVLSHQGVAATGQDLDDVAIVPVRTFVSKIQGGLEFQGTVLIAPESRADTAHIEAEVRSLLRDRHRLAPGTDDDFEVRVPIAK